MNTMVALWMKSPKISKKIKDYIIKLSQEDQNRFFSDKKLSFGTAGIRATMGPGTNQINSFTYQQMAEGTAKFFLNRNKNPKVIVAHDNRRNASVYAFIVAKVLTSFGIEVWLYHENQLKATPIVSYTIKKKQLDGAIIITASHNPKNYLGFKVYNATGCQILPDESDEINQLMPENNLILESSYVSNLGLINYFDETINNEYYEDAKSCLINTDILEDKNFPVIFTAHHGTASKDLPEFLKRIGYSRIVCVKQQCNPDPNFTYSPNSNPEDEASFNLAKKYAEVVSANIMLGVDPDSDRLAVVIKHQNNWRFLTGNEMGIIFTYYVLNHKQFNQKPFVVSTYVSTYLIDKIVADFNGIVYRTPTGFKWLGNVIEQKCQSQSFVVAFEEAIGSLNSTIGRDKDGFQAAALALEIYHYYSKQQLTLIDVLEQEIFPKYGFWAGDTVSYLIEGVNWQEQMQQRMKQLSKYKTTDIDGVKFIANKWNQKADALEWIFAQDMWVKFRLSGTEPKFKVYYNVYGDNLDAAKQRLQVFKELVADLIRR